MNRIMRVVQTSVVKRAPSPATPRPPRRARAATLAVVLAATATVVSPAPPRAAAQAPPSATVVARAGTATSVAAPDQATASATAAASPTASSATATVVPTVGAAGSPTVPGAPLDDRPILVLHDSDVQPGSPAPGDTIAVRLEVRNVGRRDAENVQLTLGGEAFLPLDRGAVLYKEEIDAAETRPFEARLRVSQSLPTGVYALSIGLRWNDADGFGYSDATSLGIQVVAPAVARPAVAIVAARVPARCLPGIPFAIVFQLANTGAGEARQVVVAPADGPLALRGGAAPPLTLPPGATTDLSLAVVAADVVEPGAVSQTFALRYEDPDGQSFSDTYPVGLVVSGDAALGPLPLVRGYTVRGPGEAAGELHPGEAFELVIEVENVGPREAQRTRLTLGGGGAAGAGGASGATLGAFAPLETGNVHFLGALGAGELRTVRQRMVVDGVAKPGAYVLEVGFDYVDPDGAPLSSAEVISLLVSRRVSLEVNPLEVVAEAVVGEPVAFSVEIVNAGDAKVAIGNAEVVGGRYVEVEDGTLFVGPLDGGEIFTLDASLVPRAPGAAQVEVVVHYVDDFYRPQTFRRTFALTIGAPPTPTPAADRPVRRADDNLLVRILKGLLGLGASPRHVVEPAEEGGVSIELDGAERPAPIEVVPAAPAGE